MKKLGILLILISVLFFVHGSVKFVEAEEETPVTYELDQDIILVEDSQEARYSNYSFNIAGLLVLLGVGLIYVGRQKKQ